MVGAKPRFFTLLELRKRAAQLHLLNSLSLSLPHSLRMYLYRFMHRRVCGRCTYREGRSLKAFRFFYFPSCCIIPTALQIGFRSSAWGPTGYASSGLGFRVAQLGINYQVVPHDIDLQHARALTPCGLYSFGS